MWLSFLFIEKLPFFGVQNVENGQENCVQVRETVRESLGTFSYFWWEPWWNKTWRSIRLNRDLLVNVPLPWWKTGQGDMAVYKCKEFMWICLLWVIPKVFRCCWLNPLYLLPFPDHGLWYQGGDLGCSQKNFYLPWEIRRFGGKQNNLSRISPDLANKPRSGGNNSVLTVR